MENAWIGDDGIRRKTTETAGRSQSRMFVAYQAVGFSEKSRLRDSSLNSTRDGFARLQSLSLMRAFVQEVGGRTARRVERIRR